MPRRRPPRPSRGSRSAERAPSTALPPVEQKGDGGWHVRRLPASRSGSDYTCPGCHRPVRAGTGHVVAWPVEKSLLSAEAVDERRHWHTACWDRRP